MKHVEKNIETILDLQTGLRKRAEEIQISLSVFDTGSYDWGKQIEKLSEIQQAIKALNTAFCAIDRLNARS